MLVYLTAQTWRSGDESKEFAKDVADAIEAGVRLLLVYEQPDVDAGEASERARRSCDFEHIRSVTPKALRNADLYNTIATPLKGGAFREASLAMLASDLCEERAAAPVSKYEEHRRKATAKRSRGVGAKVAWGQLTRKSTLALAMRHDAPDAAIAPAASLPAPTRTVLMTTERPTEEAPLEAPASLSA